jgi:hypothetical protein
MGSRAISKHIFLKFMFKRVDTKSPTINMQFLGTFASNYFYKFVQILIFIFTHV